MFVLPLMKFALQSLVAWSTKHIVEYMPGVTVFSVEVFNALYLAKCMQSAGSMSTFVVIMVFDAFESVVAYRDMKAQTQSLYETWALYSSSAPEREFVDTMIAMCHEPDVLSRRGSTIRTRSPIKLNIYRTNTAVLDELVQIQSFVTEPIAVKTSSFLEMPPSTSAVSSIALGHESSHKWYMSHSKIYPTEQDLKSQDTTNLSPARATARVQSVGMRDLPGAVEGHHHTMERGTPKSAPVLPSELHVHSSNKLSAKLGAAAKSTLTPAQLHDAVDQSLKVLFQCEYHVLVEYVEAMIPMLYCVYVAILTHLPSHVYYPETRNITNARVKKMVLNVFTHAWLEIISFVMMHFSIKWKFGFSPAYLLASVLENQAMQFQARLLVWFTYIVEITLVHNGGLVCLLCCRVCELGLSVDSLCRCRSGLDAQVCVAERRLGEAHCQQNKKTRSPGHQ